MLLLWVKDYDEVLKNLPCYSLYQISPFYLKDRWVWVFWINHYTMETFFSLACLIIFSSISAAFLSIFTPVTSRHIACSVFPPVNDKVFTPPPLSLSSLLQKKRKQCFSLLLTIQFPSFYVKSKMTRRSISLTKILNYNLHQFLTSPFPLYCPQRNSRFLSKEQFGKKSFGRCFNLYNLWLSDTVQYCWQSCHVVRPFLPPAVTYWPQNPRKFLKFFVSNDVPPFSCYLSTLSMSPDSRWASFPFVNCLVWKIDSTVQKSFQLFFVFVFF